MSVMQNHRPRRSKLIANKHRILNMIFREGSCSRFYLARKLNINASTVGNYVDDFLSAVSWSKTMWGLLGVGA